MKQFINWLASKNFILVDLMLIASMGVLFKNRFGNICKKFTHVDKGRTTDLVGRMFSTNTMYIHAAARLKASYPEYVEAAQAGEFTYADFIKLKHDERADLQQVRDELTSSVGTTVSEELSNDTHPFC